MQPFESELKPGGAAHENVKYLATKISFLLASLTSPLFLVLSPVHPTNRESLNFTWEGWPRHAALTAARAGAERAGACLQRPCGSVEPRGSSKEAGEGCCKCLLNISEPRPPLGCQVCRETRSIRTPTTTVSAAAPPPPGSQEGAADAAATVPADVAASMQGFVATLTTPETELEQQASYR